MDNKVFFEVQNSNGGIEKMELLSKLQLEQFNRKYIFYKNCDESNPHYYVASYEDEGDSDFSNLNVDFSDKEKEVLNEIFSKIKKGDFKNA
jgi:hypothetical protein